MVASGTDWEFREVDAERWPDLELLFESRGGPKYCWCMLWRAMPGSRRGDAGAKKEALAQRVQSGVPVGILGYRDGEPAAWCSIAPRPTYRDLGGATDAAGMADSVWSVVCFFVARSSRGEGLAHRLIGAAVALARARGASVVEAYPVAPDSPSYRFMGLTSWFEAAGFRAVGTAGSRRHVMRLAL